MKEFRKHKVNTTWFHLYTETKQGPPKTKTKHTIKYTEQTLDFKKRSWEGVGRRRSEIGQGD